MIHSIIDFFPDKNQWFSFVDYFLSFKAITLLGFISGLFTLIIDNTDFLNRVSNLFRYLSEFKIEKIFDDFTDETKEYHKQKRYGERIAFRSQAACQKYYDWLNEKKEN